MHIPYTYLIGWSKLNKFYYGVQYGTKANPNNLWRTYFTSSKEVKNFTNLNGNPDIIEIRKIFPDSKSAILWEQKVLRRLGVSFDDKFLNLVSSNTMNYVRLIKPNLKNITNGYINGKIPIEQDMPAGYWRGTTKFSKDANRGIKKSLESNRKKSKSMSGLIKSERHRQSLSVAATKQQENMSFEEKQRISKLFSEKYSGEKNPRYGCMVSNKQKELNTQAHHSSFIKKLNNLLGMSLDEFKKYVKIECDNGSNYSQIALKIGISYYHIKKYCD